MKYTRGDLKQRQSLPMEAKVAMTEKRIQEWYEYFDGNVYVSFSGGKDSTVLLTIARHLYPDIEAVFVDTGLEYPEIRKFVKTFDNVTILRPKMRFDEVINKYGYPIIGKRQAEAIELAKKNLADGRYSMRLMLLGVTIDEAKQMGLKMPAENVLKKYEKNFKDSKFALTQYKPLLNINFNVSAKCCDIMKKAPSYEYQKKTGKKPILATMASESAIREGSWLKNGCNAFDGKHPSSQPMSFWTEQDVLMYIKFYGISIASVYGNVVNKTNEQLSFFGNETSELKTTGCSRTGCMFCGFGCHLDDSPTRFESLKETHPIQYKYCLGGGGYDDSGILHPTKEGLGLKLAFDALNEVYSKDFIKY
jgi:3'-phosphoadenosine 5'-phosphosulfate sulfotransferase (PAPS reductase)/FAD synthetase